MYKLFLNICQYFDISPADLAGSHRAKELIIPRQIFAHIARKKYGNPKRYPHYSLKAIGRMINKDHATVLHSDRMISYDYEKHSVVYCHRSDTYIDIRKAVDEIEGMECGSNAWEKLHV